MLARLVRHIGVGGHPHAGHRLEDDLLDAIAIALQDAQDFRLERTRLLGKCAERLLELVAKIAATSLPFLARRRRLVAARSCAAWALMKVKYSRCRSFGVWAKSGCEIASIARVNKPRDLMAMCSILGTRSTLVPRLCLGTHCPHGSCRARLKSPRLRSRQAGACGQCVPRQSLGTRSGNVAERRAGWYIVQKTRGKIVMKYVFLAAMFLGLSGSVAFAQWQPQTINTKADFRGLCVVSPNVAWVSGTKGTYARTTDGGKTWSVGTVPGAEKLDFRDVEAFGEATAYLLSAGPGDASRIYKTSDGGKSWAMQFKSADPAAFFDAIAFWDEKNGIALGDPVKGRFQLVVTDDGGANWKPLAAKDLPAGPARRGGLRGQRHLPRHPRRKRRLVRDRRGQDGAGLPFRRTAAETGR